MNKDNLERQKQSTTKKTEREQIDEEEK